jgi:hypothetical protein
MYDRHDPAPTDDNWKKRSFSGRSLIDLALFSQINAGG